MGPESLNQGPIIVTDSSERIHLLKSIDALDEEKQIIYSEVYAPMQLDTYGDAMLPDDIEKMAHEFLTNNDLTKVVDTNHDNIANGSYIIESFIARKDDPNFTEGAWVVGIKVPDSLVWKKVKRGELSGLSMEALVYKVPAVADIEVDLEKISQTEEAENHTHLFYVEYTPDGVVAGGRTSTDMGHSHEIKAGTATEPTNGHAHRIYT